MIRAELIVSEDMIELNGFSIYQHSEVNFISLDNTYKLYDIDFADREVAIYVKDELLIFMWTGEFKYFQDSNGVGSFWIDFNSEDVEIKFLGLLDDEGTISLASNTVSNTDYNEDWVIEIVAQEMFEQA